MRQKKRMIDYLGNKDVDTMIEDLLCQSGKEIKFEIKVVFVRLMLARETYETATQGSMWHKFQRAHLCTLESHTPF